MLCEVISYVPCVVARQKASTSRIFLAGQIRDESVTYRCSQSTLLCNKSVRNKSFEIKRFGPKRIRIGRLSRWSVAGRMACFGLYFPSQSSSSTNIKGVTKPIFGCHKLLIKVRLSGPETRRKSKQSSPRLSELEVDRVAVNNINLTSAKGIETPNSSKPAEIGQARWTRLCESFV